MCREELRLEAVDNSSKEPLQRKGELWLGGRMKEHKLLQGGANERDLLVLKYLKGGGVLFQSSGRVVS